MALATLVKVEGSSYRRAGARLLITASGLSAGSISGGCLEADLFHHASRVIETDKPIVVTYDTTSENDLVWGVGLGCHGIATVLVEPLGADSEWARILGQNIDVRKATELAVCWDQKHPHFLGTKLRNPETGDAKTAFVFNQVIAAPLHLIVCGAGDDASPLVRMAHELGWMVTVYDPRSNKADPARFPLASQCVVGPPETIGDSLTLDERSVAVVMTHHYLYDLPILQALLPHPLAYLGLLGPHKRAEKILADIAAAGVTITPEMHARLHAPVGLDLGADGAEEVALSILAEITARLAGREARPLRERVGSIHGSDA